MIDDLAGFASDYAAKLLALNPKKFIGPVGWNIFEALGLKVVVIEDPIALTRSKRRTIMADPTAIVCAAGPQISERGLAGC
jgi:hypothetical protein